MVIEHHWKRHIEHAQYPVGTLVRMIARVMPYSTTPTIGIVVATYMVDVEEVNKLTNENIILPSYEAMDIYWAESSYREEFVGVLEVEKVEEK